MEKRSEIFVHDVVFGKEGDEIVAKGKKILAQFVRRMTNLEKANQAFSTLFGGEKDFMDDAIMEEWMALRLCFARLEEELLLLEGLKADPYEALDDMEAMKKFMTDISKLIEDKVYL